jgi:hypothetical protein
MLLSLSVTNWMSFRDEAILNMIATREKQHPHHVTHISPLDLKLLPIAAIYGGNASGKSNLIKAIRFVEQFILNPPKPDASIPIRPFRLEEGEDSRPTSFAISILVEDSVYEYSFSLSTKKVLREELKRIGASEERLFLRTDKPEDFYLSPKIQNGEEQKFAFRGTHDNQLFLSNSISQKLTEFKPVYDWFVHLQLIFPDSSFSLMRITREGHPLHDKFVIRMRELDSGIASFQQKKILPEDALSKALVETLSADLKEGETYDGLPWLPGISLRKENGAIVGQRLTPMHRNARGEEIPFDLEEESDGTQRLFDIVPAFLFLEEDRPRIFVIDELDRSLHALLTRELLQRYLALDRKEPSRAQLIFTTHDVSLLTQDLFRRDEIWVAERDQSGASKLVAFSEFSDVRRDKDIRKSYLQGRLGGIPRIRSIHRPCEEDAVAQ